MTEKETKAKAPKKETAAKAAPKAAAKPAAKAEKRQSAPAGASIRVTQLVGCIARRRDQEATLIGLGLNKRHRSRVLADTPAIRGMIRKVSHLVKVEQA